MRSQDILIQIWLFPSALLVCITQSLRPFHCHGVLHRVSVAQSISLVLRLTGIWKSFHFLKIFKNVSISEWCSCNLRVYSFWCMQACIFVGMYLWWACWWAVRCVGFSRCCSASFSKGQTHPLFPLSFLSLFSLFAFIFLSHSTSVLTSKQEVKNLRCNREVW